MRFIGYRGDGALALYAVQSGHFDSLQTSLNVADQQAIEPTLPLAANAVWKHSSKRENLVVGYFQLSGKTSSEGEPENIGGMRIGQMKA